MDRNRENVVIKDVKEINEERAKLNKIVLERDDINIKRFLGLDSFFVTNRDVFVDRPVKLLPDATSARRLEVLPRYHV